jgi:GNAT superfamily N-acetyltransferase
VARRPTGLPGLRIAPLRPEYAGEVLTVQRAAYVTEAQRYREPAIPPLTETVEQLRADLAGGVLALGAWLDHRLIGAVRGRVDGAWMEVARFVVAPDMQRQGVGAALLTAVQDAAPTQVSVFWLTTGARSEDNLSLYRRAGYRVTGRTTDGAGVDLVRMERARAVQ